MSQLTLGTDGRQPLWGAVRMYLCYDIKGIQHFIFSVPRLKCMIGASGQIAQFDEKYNDQSVPQIAENDAAKYIFSGGGRGAFRFPSEKDARDFANRLIKEAHQIGLDVRIGIDAKYSNASQRADELYPYCPQDLSGRPCGESGLWPVPGNVDKKSKKPHPKILARMRLARKDILGRAIIKRIKSRPAKQPQLSAALVNDYEIEFFLNVNPDEPIDDSAESESESEKDLDRETASAGCASLGNRNRWAVIAMDGNDMGKQFTRLYKDFGSREEDYFAKLRSISDALKRITQHAFDDALVGILNDWFENLSKEELAACVYEHEGQKRLVLPFRPLILGGDDLVVLCHCSLAIDFVQWLADRFASLSKTIAEDLQKTQNFSPWSATGGKLSISAGVLFTKVSLPLHVAIPYAESLLASAKGRYRGSAAGDHPTPAAIDWETITDTMVDTPAARRNRELCFIDKESDAVLYLTRRPYLLRDEDNAGHNPTLAGLIGGTLKQLDGTPNTFRAELKRAMNQVWSERMRYLLSIAREEDYKEISNSLRDGSGSGGAGKGSAWHVSYEFENGKPVPRTENGMPVRETDVVDALLLLDEQRRSQQETA